MDELGVSSGQVTTAMDELGVSSEELRDQQIKLANTPIVPDDLPTALQSVGDASNQAAEQFQQVAEKLASLNFQQPTQITSGGSETSDIVQRILEATSTAGEAVALRGTVAGQPQVAAAGAAITTVADVALRLKENIEASQQSASDLQQQLQQMSSPAQQSPTPQTADMSAVNTALSEISQKLGEVSQRAGEIANSANKPPQQNINVSPNINVNLGGAYVFDESMKAQLTDDITREVTDAITSAVQKATSQANYGYGN